MRQVLAGLAAVLVLGAVVYVGWRALEDWTLGGDDTVEGADATVDTYLDAWADGDTARMASLVRAPPEAFADHHELLRDDLTATSLTARRIDLVEEVDGRATATAAITTEVPDVGTLQWEVELRLLRERGTWGIAWEPASLHPAWRPGLRFAVSDAVTDRAPILARDGTVLAGPGRRTTFGLEPGAVRDVDEVVDAFEAAADGAGDTAARILSRSDLVDGWFYPVVSLDDDQAREAGAAVSGVAGVLRRIEDDARSLLADGFAVHVVGRVAEATAEELERLGPPYEPGDLVGRGGLEQALERRLAAGNEVRVELRDGAQGPVRATLATSVDGEVVQHEVIDGEPDDGAARALTTTLDVTVQRAIENALAGRDTPTAIVVVDAADGAVRGTASRPLDGFDRALQGRYPAGTAFAPVVVDAARQSGADVGEVPCPAAGVVAGRRLENVDDVEVADGPLAALAASGCATTLAAVGADVGADALVAAAERFGAGRDLDLHVVANGLSLPLPEDAGETAVSAAGQGRVEVSPLHLASVAAASTTGRWWAPYLLEEDGAGDPSPLAGGTIDAAAALWAPTDDANTGLRGFEGAARGPDGVVHRWFVGVVDGYGVAVLVEDDGDGAEDAGPVAVRFARELRALEDAPEETDR